MKEGTGCLIQALLFALYVFGMFVMITDDHRYTTKDIVIGAVFFPYPWYVGGKEAYRYMTTSKENRKMEEECLDAFEALNIPRKARLRVCECVVETKNPELCKSKFYGK